MSPSQISVLIAIWSITQLILEIPTGIIADKFSRRNVLIAALLFVALGFTFWLKGSFLFYAIGMVFWGVKNALTSGTFDAFVYDELKTQNQHEHYETINGRTESAFWVGVACAAVLSTWVASINFNFVIVSSIITSFLGIAVLLTIQSVRPVKELGERHYFVVLKEAVKEVLHNTTLLEIVLFMCLVFSIYSAADEWWALLYQSFGIPLPLIGVFIAVGYGLFAIAGYSLHLFKRVKNGEYVFLILSSILFIIAGIGKSIPFILLVFLGIFIFKIADFKFNAKFQHAIASNQRATISSLKSLLFEFIYMLGVLFFGFTSSKLGMHSILYFMGGIMIFWIIFFKLQARFRNF